MWYSDRGRVCDTLISESVIQWQRESVWYSDRGRVCDTVTEGECVAQWQNLLYRESEKERKNVFLGSKEREREQTGSGRK